ncbi:glycosyltransferase family 2 protein [Leisingera thetidis]|uniref:glycosyltransferase family 2 protein n=1 Tax=Leisingera thetidis TaxID=2930199 RepID=UPI0021F79676|nr:glycosyltransferase family 2 protein [Leisingera thetidis]
MSSRADPAAAGASAAAPLVSVVMPAYNAAAVLGRAVASVRAQTLADWELLIADDGSRDGTGALARAEAAREPRIRVLALPENRGAAAARNLALAAARGRYIAFLDADDTWLPQKLARQVGWMQAEGIAFSYTSYLRGDGQAWSLRRAPASVTRRQLLRGNAIGCLTAVCDRQMLGDFTMPGFRRRQDYALWLQLLRRVPQAHGLDEPLACYWREKGRASLSSNLLKGARGTLQVYREQEQLSWPLALWCLLRHLSRHLRPRRRRPLPPGAAP